MIRRVEDSQTRAVTRGSYMLAHRGDNGARWFHGPIQTPHGIVEVYSQGLDDRDNALTWYRFVWGGYIHRRYEYGVARRSRGLAIMAARFAREIATVPRQRPRRGMPVVRP